MDPNQNSFLFFIATLFAMAAAGAGVYGQQVDDSLNFYYRGIVHPGSVADLPEGIDFYSRRKQGMLRQKDTLGAIECLRLIAIGQYKIGSIYDSENTVVEALRLIDRHSGRDTLISSRIGLYNQLGMIYRAGGDRPGALLAYNNALKIARKLSDSITLLNNKANIYKDVNQYEQALQQYELIYALTSPKRDSLQVAMVMDNMGAVLSAMNRPAAIDTLLKALAIRERYKDYTGLYASYKNLAQYYADRNDRATALDYAHKAREVAAHIRSNSFRYDALELLMKLNGDPDVAEYIRLTDSISVARQLAENKNAYIKYNLEAERRKTALEELQKEREQRSKQLFQLSTGFILLLLVLAIFIFRYRYKKGQQEAMFNTETRISKRIHDELANDVFNLLSYAESKQMEGNRERLLAGLDTVYHRVRDIARSNSGISTGPEFADNLKGLLSGYTTPDTHVIIKGLDSIPWAKTTDLKKVACFRVLQELMVNMKKHSRASVVLITFRKAGNRIIINYSDNGTGLSAVKDINRGGLWNAENRMEAVSGSFTFSSRQEKGFKGILEFPV